MDVNQRIKTGGKRLLTAAVSLIFLAVLLPLGTTAAASSTDITKRCTLSVSTNQNMQANLTDGNTGSKNTWKGGKGSSIRIESPEAIGGVYILWQYIPKNWSMYSVQGGNREVRFTGGSDMGASFLHDYYPIYTDNETSIELCFDSGAQIAELYVMGKGTLPSWVQQWQPMLEKADMLVMSTHADDELLWFGGTMPVYAGEYGKKVQVSYLTNHGPGRTHELLNGLWTVGVRNYPFIAPYPDHYAGNLEKAKSLYDEEDILRHQVELLRRFKPDVIVAQDINGEYGHGVHRLNTETLIKALDIVNDASRYPESAQKYGTWQVKKCYLHLYKENRLTMDWSQPLKNFGGKTALDVAKDGFACHISQQKPKWKVRDYDEYDCRKFGLFYTTVGLDVVKNDFFENVAPCVTWAALDPDTIGTKPPDKPPTEVPTNPPTEIPTETATEPETTAIPTETQPEQTEGSDQAVLVDINATQAPDETGGIRLLFYILPAAVVVLAAAAAVAVIIIYRQRKKKGGYYP